MGKTHCQLMEGILVVAIGINKRSCGYSEERLFDATTLIDEEIFPM
jgi:hypothetical protein